MRSVLQNPRYNYVLALYSSLSFVYHDSSMCHELTTATFDVTCVIASVIFLTQGVSLHCILHLRDLVLVCMGCAPVTWN